MTLEGEGYRPGLADDPYVRGAGAFLIYLALSFLFLGRGLIGHFSTSYIGQGFDVQLAVWCMAWMPYAISHRVNLLVTHLLFVPHGLNLTWATSNPLGGLIGSPITALGGPVASYNCLCILAPAMAGWALYLVCHRLTARWWPSLIAGYLFGFSSYILATLYNGWVDRALIFPVPLAIYVGLRVYDGTLGRQTTILLLIAIEAAQFLFSTEVFLVACAFGVMVGLLALAILDRNERRRMLALLYPIATSFFFVFAILSPYVYFIVASGIPKGPIWATSDFVNSPLGIVFPSDLAAVAHLQDIHRLLKHFVNPSTRGFGFIGPVVIAILAVYCWRHFRAAWVRILACSFVVIVILSLGQQFVIAGRTIPNIPGRLWSMLPELNKALPNRFSMFYMLAASIMVALWLASDSARAGVKWGAAGLALLLAVPTMSARFWVRPAKTPAFFSSDIYRQYLTPHQTIVILPYAYRANTMLWQATTNMYFRMASGHSWPLPYEYARWPIVIGMCNKAYLPDPGIQFKAFLAAHNVNTVIVDNRASNYWWRLAKTLNVKPVSVGGVSIYHVGSRQLERYRSVTPVELERAADAARLSETLVATAKFVADGGDLANINVGELEKRGLLHRNWYGGPDLRISVPIWLKPQPQGQVAVGIFGSEAALNPLVESYGPLGMRVERIPIQSPLNPGGEASLQLVIFVFDRAGLARAAANAAKMGQPSWRHVSGGLAPAA